MACAKKRNMDMFDLVFKDWLNDWEECVEGWVAEAGKGWVSASFNRIPI